MAAKIEKISGVVFLPFIDMKELLLSELQRRFNYDCSNAIYYGDLVYLPDYNIETGIPYFARCAMLEPYLFVVDVSYHYLDFLFLMCLGYLCLWRGEKAA